MNFSQVAAEYQKLKAQYHAGALTEANFRARLQNMMTQDAQGRWWIIGYETGQWYFSENEQWVRAEPPVSPEKSKWLWIGVGFAGAVLVIATVALLVCRGHFPLPQTPTVTFAPSSTTSPIPCASCAGFVIGRGYGCPANMEAVGPGVSYRSCTDTFILPSPITTTQVRIGMTKRALEEYGYSLYEVEAYGPGDSTNAKNLLKGGTVSVSSVEDGRYIAANATDGDKTSRWASEKGRDPQWLEITLPQSALVDRIVLKWERAYATEYCVIVKPAQ